MKQRLAKILDGFHGKKVLVIGDIMLDKYLWGDVSRISPEAPVQVVNVLRETNAPGGAANVASNVSSLSGVSYMVGIIGNDEAKNVLLREMKDRGIITEGIMTDLDKPTTQKIRIVGKSQQLLRVDYEKKEHSHREITESIKRYFQKTVMNVDVIIISDYAKGVINKEIFDSLKEEAKLHRKPIIVDPKPKHKELYKGVFLITPNNSEASEMAGIEDGTDETVLEIGHSLLKNLDTNVLVTRGEKGMALFEKTGKISHIPAKAKEVFSLIGAGDTVIATIALALASGAGLEDACFLSNIAAGIKVGKMGTASVTIEEIKAELEKL